MYIGRTNNIERRFNQHFSKVGHLPEECYIECESVEFLTLTSPIDMEIGEIFFINKYKPKYNNSSKYEKSNNTIDINIIEEWEPLDFDFIKKRYNYLKYRESFLNNLKDELDELKKEQVKLSDKITNMETIIKKYDDYELGVFGSITKAKLIDKSGYCECIKALKNLYDMILNKELDKINYRYKSSNLVLVNMTDSWDYILHDCNIAKNKFFKQGIELGLFEGNSRDYSKTATFSGKSKRASEIDLKYLKAVIDKRD